MQLLEDNEEMCKIIEVETMSGKIDIAKLGIFESEETIFEKVEIKQEKKKLREKIRNRIYKQKLKTYLIK